MVRSPYCSLETSAIIKHELPAALLGQPREPAPVAGPGGEDDALRGLDNRARAGGVHQLELVLLVGERDEAQTLWRPAVSEAEDRPRVDELREDAASQLEEGCRHHLGLCACGEDRGPLGAERRTGAVRVAGVLRHRAARARARRGLAFRPALHFHLEGRHTRAGEAGLPRPGNRWPTTARPGRASRCRRRGQGGSDAPSRFPRGRVPPRAGTSRVHRATRTV